MTKTELFSLVDRYMHRSNDSQNLEDWLKFAESRIGERLRAFEMETSATIDQADLVTAGQYRLPQDFLEVRFVFYKDDALKPVEQIERYQTRQAGGSPRAYYLTGDSILLIPEPAVDDAFAIRYFARPAPLTDVDEQNLLLNAHPDLYLYGVLREGATWAREGDLFSLADLRFNGMVEEINAIDSRRRYGPGIAMGNLGDFGVWSGTNGGM